MLDGHQAVAPTLTDVLLDEVDASAAIRPTRVDRLDILPADVRLADAAVELATEELGANGACGLAL